MTLEEAKKEISGLQHLKGAKLVFGNQNREIFSIIAAPIDGRKNHEFIVQAINNRLGFENSTPIKESDEFDVYLMLIEPGNFEWFITTIARGIPFIEQNRR